MIHSLDHAKTIVFITLDTLRYDAAQRAFANGRLPTLLPYLPQTGWERRHTPASFTYAAHHAFFSGFLPTPTTPGPHPRPYAAAFTGSESTDESTFVFPEATLPEALSARGFRTICIGGTGFFNQQNELGSVLPNLFDEAHWDETLGVTDPNSATNQVKLASELLQEETSQNQQQPVFLFINIAALHQPNWFYDATAERNVDTLDSHIAALVAVDSALPPLFNEVTKRGRSSWIICSDHGTAYGENGHFGHRHAQSVIWDVPFASFDLDGLETESS